MILLTNRDYMKLIGYIPCDNHDVRKVAKAQLKKMVDLLKQRKDDSLGFDWGERQGAPIVVFILNPLEWEDLLKEVENERSIYST